MSGILVGVTHNLELPTEHILPSPLSTSAPVQSPVTTSTGLVHALHYGFIIFVLSYSVTLLDIRPEAHQCVSAYLHRQTVFGLYCLLYTFINCHYQIKRVNCTYVQLHKFCLLECHMHATHTVHLTQCVCLLFKRFKLICSRPSTVVLLWCHCTIYRMGASVEAVQERLALHI